MLRGVLEFCSKRLKQARHARGLTQIALGELINVRNSSSLSRWENGEQSPEPKTLEKLAAALNVPIAFFLRPPPDRGQTPIFFRSMTAATQQWRNRMKARMGWVQEIARSLEEWVEFPEVLMPCFECKHHQEIRNEDIERMAHECRSVWKLGMGPISDVFLALENAGIIVIKEEIGSAKMDGLSNWSTANDRPYILIASDKDNCVRSRMSAAHELGHMILHRNLKPENLNNPSDFKEIEQQAFDFAGAFLMPAESFSAEIHEPSLNVFELLKGRWKVSIAAMIMRCGKLEFLDSVRRQLLWKRYSNRGWKRCEPLDDTLKTEYPRLLNRSVRLLTEKGVRTREALLTDFRLHESDVEKLCGLPSGFMSTEEATLVRLSEHSQTLRPSMSASGKKGEVIPFNKEKAS